MNGKTMNQMIGRLKGQPCWGLQYQRDLNLSLNFGRPSLRIQEPFYTNSKSPAVRRIAAQRLVTVRGQWWLWIWGSHWRLSSNGDLLAAGSSSVGRIERALDQLTGQKLVSLGFHTQTGATCFAFDLGVQLECRRFEKKSDMALWMLYQPNGYVISAYGDGTYRREQSIAVERCGNPLADALDD